MVKAIVRYMLRCNATPRPCGLWFVTGVVEPVGHGVHFLSDRRRIVERRGRLKETFIFYNPYRMRRV